MKAIIAIALLIVAIIQVAIQHLPREARDKHSADPGQSE